MAFMIHRRLARAARVGLVGVVAAGVLPGWGAAAQAQAQTDPPPPPAPVPDPAPAPAPVPLAVPDEVILRVDAPLVSEKGSSVTAVGITASFPDGSGVLSEDAAVAVSVGSAGDSAVGSPDGSGADYANVESFEVVIPAGESNVAVGGAFILSVTDDDLAEGWETLTVAGSTAAAGIGKVSGAVITIVDDDGWAVLTADSDPGEGVSSRVEEGVAAQVEVSAELPAGVVAEREVTVSISVGAEGDGATGSEDGSGADYAQVDDFEIVIPAGAGRGAGSFTLETTADETAGEGEEPVTVSGTATSAEGFAVTSATVFIVDGDEADADEKTDGDGAGADEKTPGLDEPAEVVVYQTPAPDRVVLSADVSEAEEGAAAAPTVTITAAFPDGTATLSSAVTVSVTVGKSGDTATGSADGTGADYTAVAGFNLEIAAGTSSVTQTTGFTLTVTDDSLAEGDETLTITGSTAAAGITAVEEAVITITDDADSTITLTVDTDPGPDTSDEVREVRTLLPVVAGLPSGITAARSLRVYLGLGAAGDVAVGSDTGAGADYRTVGLFDYWGAIPEGQSGFVLYDRDGNPVSVSEPLVLQATDDDLAGEGRESVSVTGRAVALPARTGIAGFSVASGTVYIVDSDRVPDISLRVNPARVGEADSSPLITVTAAYADSPLQVAADVTVAVVAGKDGDSATGSADGTGADYATPSIPNITIASGSQTGQTTFNLALTNDSESEGDHSLTLIGASSLPGLALAENIEAVITITDDDDLITLTLSSASLGEGSGTNGVMVTAALPSGVTATGGITVSVTAGKSGDSATGSADGNGADYTNLTVPDITIASGDSSATTSAQDVIITQDELAEGDEVITFTGSVGSTYQVSEAVLTIEDDDADITLSVNPASAAESGGVAAITVTAALATNKTAAADLSVAVSVGKAGDAATGSDTGAGADYANVEDFEVQIAAGGTQGTEDFNLRVTDDSDWEGSATQSVTLVGTLASFTINEPVITITGDNDLNPASCGDGTYVDNPSTQTGLASDCRALVNVRNHWVSTAVNYDWPSDHPVREWGVGAAAKIGNWEGVSVTDTDPGSPVVRRVTELEMLNETATPSTEDLRHPGLNVSGTLPAAIGDLTALENLLLNNNLLVGSIPTEFGSLVNLKKLYLHGNLLFGALPSELGSLTSLTELLLTDNLLRGGIPSELGSLTNLTKLWLDDNLLSGAIPAQLGNLSNLEELHLHQNLLSGAIPAQLGNLANLRELILSNNYSTRFNPTLKRIFYNSGLTGSIPRELGKLGNLEKLRLDDNALSGTIPAALGNLSQLEELWLEENALSGAVPTELGNLSSLTGMNLEDNQLTSIPASLGNLSNLEYLILGNNLISSVPATLGNLGNLETLVLSNNRLTGALPTELGKLAPSQGGSLRILYIHNPGPLGPIPEPLLGIVWVDLFAYDDPLDLIAFYEFTSDIGTGPRTYEIWTCDVGDDFNITPQAATNLLNSQVTDFFKDMSGNLFSPTFTVGGAVVSTITRAAGGIELARKSCRDQIRPNRDRQGEYRDIDRKIIIIDNSSSRGGFMQQFTRLGISPGARSSSEYQKLTADSIIQVGGGTVVGSFARIGTVAHEIGHEIQWPHSYGGRTLRYTPSSGQYRISEYDNLMDLMSGRTTFGLTTGTIAPNRYSAGWIEPEEVAVHTGGAAAYELRPVGEDGTQMLVIPTAWGPGVFYTLSPRVREGIDSTVPLEGVELYYIDQRSHACNSSFAGLCANTSRRTQPINAPRYDPGLTIENVFTIGDAFTLPVGVTQRLRVEITGQETSNGNNKFRVSVAALPFTPVSSRSILGLPERMEVSVTTPSGNSRTVREGGSLPFTVTVSYPSGSRTSRYPAQALVSVGGTATPGSDYRGVDDFAITIPAGVSRAARTFTLRANSDSRQDGGETVTLSVRSPGYTVSGQRQVTFTIQDPPPDDRGGGGGGGGGSPSPAPAPSPAPSGPPAPPPAPPAEPPAPAYAGRFSDEDGSVHESSVETIAGWGVTVGCDAADPALFCPSLSITRRQMSAFLYRAVVHQWGTPPAAERAELADVGDDAWFRLFADWAVENGVMEVVEGLFNPGGVVTRADMAVMLVAAFPHLSAVEEAQDLFGDLEGVDGDVVRAVEGLFGSGVTKGCTDSPLRYCPDQPVTRAQMASFFVRALNQAPNPVSP